MINVQHIQQLGDGDPDFIRDLLDAFLQDTPLLLDQLVVAAHAHDWPAAGRLLHQLKSNFALFGFENLSQAVRQLETDIQTNPFRPERIAAIDHLAQNFRAVLPALNALKGAL